MTSAERAFQREARARWERARRTEISYGRQLRSVAQQVAQILKGFSPEYIAHNMGELEAILRQYSHTLTPWARSVATRMIMEAGRRESQAWRELTKSLGGALTQQLKPGALLGTLIRQELDYEAGLITSLPLVAAERVRNLTIERLSKGLRFETYAKELAKTAEITKGRATLIARTETARTAALLTERRSESIGATHYRWLTTGDANVRSLHKKLNNRIFRWDDPPVSGESGERSNPGQIYNCRCIAIPILPKV